MSELFTVIALAGIAYLVYVLYKDKKIIINNGASHMDIDEEHYPNKRGRNGEFKYFASPSSTNLGFNSTV